MVNLVPLTPLALGESVGESVAHGSHKHEARIVRSLLVRDSVFTSKVGRTTHEYMPELAVNGDQSRVVTAIMLIIAYTLTHREDQHITSTKGGGDARECLCTHTRFFFPATSFNGPAG